MGPEALMKYIDASEYIKRLAAAQGIDVLNLVKSMQQLQQEAQLQQQQAQQQSLVDQAGQLASAPAMDPTKNPNLENMNGGEQGNTAQASPQEVSA